MNRNFTGRECKAENPTQPDSADLIHSQLAKMRSHKQAGAINDQTERKMFDSLRRTQRSLTVCGCDGPDHIHQKGHRAFWECAAGYCDGGPFSATTVGHSAGTNGRDVCPESYRQLSGHSINMRDIHAFCLCRNVRVSVKDERFRVA